MSDENDIPGNEPDEPIEPLSKLLLRLQLSNVRNHYHELAQTAASRAKSPTAMTRAWSAGFAWLASRYSKPWISSSGAGRRKSTGRRSRTCSIWASSSKKANVLFLSGTPGLGKTHLSIALGRAACSSGYSVLFTTAINMIQTLSAAASVGAGELQHVMQRYLKPAMLICDEVGYLPIDKLGADLLFQVVSQRYERGSIVLTTNRPFKKWAQIFNNDSTLTSALLDRLLHHAEVIVIEGTSFRGKDLVDPDPTA
jgi:hypothetical protein